MRMTSLFQTASGSWHWPSIILAISWLVTGVFMVANLVVNRRDRMIAFAKEQVNARVISDTKTELKDARQDALKARTVAEELEKQQAPRSITTDQQARFVQFLAAHPKGKLEFRCIAGNNEATNYTSLIKGMLAKAGYEIVEPTLGIIVSGGPISGIQLKVKSTTVYPAHTLPIQKAFESIGIKADGAEEASAFPLPDDTVRIYVYGKS